ncbi:MAG TPA: carbonic anhydrase [Candidatus Binataceae bacterium]|nr:carbonic anhydrase [Candidatus Binataceae bacterium]
MASKRRLVIWSKLVHTVAPMAIFATLAFAPYAWCLDASNRQPPAVALQQLLDGNARFVADKATHPNSRPSDAAQHPAAVILSCSDSRVPPEILFDQGVGALFVVRAAGNTYDQLALESIEYAVTHLGTSLIVVMGHDQCGAVTAAVKEYPKLTVGPMLKNIYPAVEKTKGQPGDPVSNAISENAVITTDRLAKDPRLAPLVAGGQLKIVAARYNLATGTVTMLPPK